MLHRAVVPGDDMQTVTHKVLQSAVSALANLERHVRREQLERAAARIAKARRVDCYGVGNVSMFMASDAQARFARLGITSGAYFDGHLQLISAATMTRNDVVLAISYVGRLRSLINAAEVAKEQGAMIVAITQRDTPLARLADVVLPVVVPVDHAMRVGTEAYLAQLAYLEILMVGVGLRRGPRCVPAAEARAAGAEGAGIRKRDPPRASIRVMDRNAMIAMNPSSSNRTRALVLRGGTIIDGTGANRFVADRAVEGDRITAIGADLSRRTRKVVDARGMRSSRPGSVDVHTHDDQIVLADPRMLPKITQGADHVIVGNCGISLAPLVHADVPPPLNLLGGHDKYIHPTMAAYVAAVGRAQACSKRGSPGRPLDVAGARWTIPTAPRPPPSRRGWSSCCAKALDAGAIGLSSGVFYATGAAADVDELALLAGVAGDAGGIYTTHIRDEMNEILAALDEAFTAARRGACRWSSRITSARARRTGAARADAGAHRRGARAQPIGLDAYPTSPARPSCARTGRRRHRRRRHVVGAASGDGGAAPGRHRRRVELHAAGSVRAAAAGRRLLLPDARGRRAARAALSRHDDRLGRLPHDRHPHPRLWGTFPRVLGHYSRDLGSSRSRRRAQDDGPERATVQPARARRASLRPGWFADLCVFESGAGVVDAATFERPQRGQPRDRSRVLVNGIRDLGPARARRRGSRAGGFPWVGGIPGDSSTCVPTSIPVHQGRCP
jgi:N-acyl-D-amino-acid deacylase